MPPPNNTPKKAKKQARRAQTESKKIEMHLAISEVQPAASTPTSRGQKGGLHEEFTNGSVVSNSSNYPEKKTKTSHQLDLEGDEADIEDHENMEINPGVSIASVDQ